MARPKNPATKKANMDLEKITLLAKYQATDAEIAVELDVAPRTFRLWKEKHPELIAALEKGKEAGKTAIRRAQYRAALRGNVTMLIWLGKQYLGQSDQAEIHHHEHTDVESAYDRLLGAFDKYASNGGKKESPQGSRTIH